ncbi:MAG: HEAT repeat domain-containing protein [Planctomycetota bacterium]
MFRKLISLVLLAGMVLVIGGCKGKETKAANEGAAPEVAQTDEARTEALQKYEDGVSLYKAGQYAEAKAVFTDIQAGGVDLGRRKNRGVKSYIKSADKAMAKAEKAKAAEVKEETVVAEGPKPEEVKEVPAVEEKKEEPAPVEKKEEPKVEEKKEESKVEEKKEEPKVEEKKEEPKPVEVKEEPKVEEKKETPKVEEKKEALTPVAEEKSVKGATGVAPKAVGQPLVDALKDDDKRIRYAAAEALVKINPREPFACADLVVPVLAEAVGETRLRTVLLVVRDIEARNRLKGVLLDLKYIVTVAKDGREGLSEAKRFPTEDVILLDAVERMFDITNPIEVDRPGKKNPALDIQRTIGVIEELRRDFRTKNLPVIILTDPANDEEVKKAYAGFIQGTLPTPWTREKVEGQLKAVFEGNVFQFDSKARALEAARAAARALASIDPERSIYALEPVVPNLVDSLAVQPDEVRGPVIQALGQAGDYRAVEALRQVFDNKDNKPEIRAECLTSVGKILAKNHGKITDPLFESLASGLREEIEIVRAEAGKALGKANLSSDQVKRIYDDRRPDMKK